ncbi:MAG: hypothetical protein ABSF08_07170 [Candidatus Cybelea sp.]
MIPRNPATAPARREIVTRAQLLRVVTRPAVTPAPRPRPTAILSPVSTPPPQRAHQQLADAAEGRAPRHDPAARLRPAPAQRYGVKPVWDLGAAGGTGKRAAAQAGGSESGFATNGAGSSGAGSGAATGTEPCGFVEFSDPHGSAFDARTRGFYVDIRMQVHFADGTSQSLVLDYPWYYPSESANPWSNQNLRNQNFPTRFQPPPAANIAAEPALVRYVMEHSTADGMTLLRDCPQATPNPPPP